MSKNLLDGNKFILGANLAWLDGQFDHDFGKNQIRGIITPAYNNPVNKANFSAYLQDMKKMGMEVVRLWVFERFEGLIFDNNGFVTHDPTLINNLADACAVASKIGLKFYLCLMDTWGTYSSDLTDTQKVTNLSAINGLITTQDKTSSYVNNVILPLLNDSRIKDSIFAIDILNEPEGLTPEKINGALAAGTTYPPISWDQIISFIKTCAISIKTNTNLLVSCGFSDVNSIQNDPYGLANYLDFFDLHEYDDQGNLPSYLSLGLKKPCIIGECGQMARQWNDQLQQDATKSFLNNAKNGGYAGCFVWNYNCRGFTKVDENWWSLINSDGSHRLVCSMISEFAQNIT